MSVSGMRILIEGGCLIRPVRWDGNGLFWPTHIFWGFPPSIKGILVSITLQNVVLVFIKMKLDPFSLL